MQRLSDGSATATISHDVNWTCHTAINFFFFWATQLAVFLKIPARQVTGKYHLQVEHYRHQDNNYLHKPNTKYILITTE